MKPPPSGVRHSAKGVSDFVRRLPEWACRALLIVGVTSCGTGGPEPIDMDDVRGASYESEWASSGTARLRGGEFREPAAPGSAAELVISVHETAFGDLNGDGIQDAAVVLVTHPGGSGTFYDVHALIGATGQPADVGSAFLGDRIVLRGLAVQPDGIHVDLLDRREDDPMSAPPMIPRQARYELTEGGLIESQSGEPRQTVGLEGYEWTLSAIRDSAAEPIDITAGRPPSVSFTAELANEDDEDAARRLAGFGGCNRFMGSYTASGDRLVISPLGTTLMMCPPDVMRIEDAFLPAFQAASRFAIEGTRLTITAGDRELVFERGSAVEPL